MSFSYDPTLPTDLDKVRLALGDTDSTAPLLSNEEITAMLETYIGVLQTAAPLAESLAAKFARRVNISVDGLSKSYSDLSRNFALLAERLRARATDEAGGLGMPLISGVSIAAMTSVDDNTDRVPSQFKIGQFDDTPKEGGGEIGGSNQGNN